MSEHICHPFAPVIDRDCEILILGSLPSVMSRRNAFYYGHPRNRFWPLIAGIFDEPVPEDVDEKQALLLRHHIALWDVIAECDIEGSSDASIQNVVPGDLMPLLENSGISRIFCNGQAALKYYRKYQEKKTGIPAQVLPSTSPANAAWSLERLREVWKEKLDPQKEAGS